MSPNFFYSYQWPKCTHFLAINKQKLYASIGKKMPQIAIDRKFVTTCDLANFFFLAIIIIVVPPNAVFVDLRSAWNKVIGIYFYDFWPPKTELRLYFYLKAVVFLLIKNYWKIGHNLRAKTNHFHCLKNKLKVWITSWVTFANMYLIWV